MLINNDEIESRRQYFRRRILFPSILCALVVFFSFFQFWGLLRGTVNETSTMFLTELNIQRLHKIRGSIQNHFLFLDSLSTAVSKYDDLGMPEALQVLREQASYPDLISFTVRTPDGRAWNGDGSVVDEHDLDLFRLGMHGERTIRAVSVPYMPGGTLGVLFSGPIYRSGKVVGVLSLLFGPEVLLENETVKVFGGQSATYIFDHSGSVLFQRGTERISSKNTYIDTFLDFLSRDSGDNSEELRKNIKENKEGYFVWRTDTERFHLDYRKLGVNGWYLLSAVPGQAIDAQPYLIARMTFLLCGIVAASLLLLIWFIFHVARKSAHSIAQAQQQFTLLVANIPGGVVCCLNDAEFTLTSYSKGFLELTGYTDEELGEFFDHKYRNMICEEDRKAVQISLEEQLKYGNTIELLHRVRCKNGKFIRVLEKGQLAFPEKGESVYYSVIVDISAQFEARQQLEESKQELENLTSNIPGGVIRCRYDTFALEYASEGYIELLGYSRAELMAMKETRLACTIHPQDLERIQQEVVERFENEKVLEIEFRLVHKKGNAIWVYYKGRLSENKDGTKVVDALFIDITDRKATLDSLYISEERYRLLAELTDAIVYEYDIKNDSVYISQRWEEKFGYPFCSKDVVYSLQGTDLVQEEDKKMLFSMLEDLMGGKSTYGECEYRLRVASGQYIWCRNIATVVVDKDGLLVKILGKIFDIDKAKKEQEELTERAQRDPLTGLYNKGATRTIIESYLENEGKDDVSAFMVVDVDNFKSVNDNLGHMFGDTVLSSISSDIQRLFRSTDVIGRIGGDEFVVFLKKMPLESFVVKGANAICEALQNTFAGESGEYRISGSIGIAMYPQDGATYNELFKNADNALYKSKNKGKNQFSFYNMDTDFCLLACDLTTTLPLHQTTMPRTRSPYVADLPARILEALCDARDLSTAITFTLQFVGKQYSVSRVYIFERDFDGVKFNNTHEWCAEGVSSKKEYLQDLDLERDYNYSSLFSEDGVFYCPDISKLGENLYALLEPQDIRSMLQCSFREDNHFKGFIGFDECSEKRLWTKSEVESLALIARILGLFMVKMRTNERQKRNLSMFESVINNRALWIYVINPTTYEILFLNQVIRERSAAVEGTICYKVLRDRNAPCPDCPMYKLSEEYPSNTPESCTEPLEGVEATASFVSWQEPEQAVLICCFDNTPYKTGACPPLGKDSFSE